MKEQPDPQSCQAGRWAGLQEGLLGKTACECVRKEYCKWMSCGTNTARRFVGAGILNVVDDGWNT